MYVAKGNEFLREISLSSLEQRYLNEENAKAKTRMQCALLRKKGKSIPFIVEVTGLSHSTVSDILRRFASRGVDGCYAIKQKGQPPKISLKQRKKLAKVVQNSPQKIGLPFVIWTTKLVQYYIKHTFKKQIVTRHIRRLLISDGLSLQKQRPEHIKANKRLQAAFKKNFDDRSNTLNEMDMRSRFWTKLSSH